MMGYQATLQASPKTWPVQDESVTRVRKSMGKWADLCKSMAKYFGRGINRTCLAMAYREHGVKQCPRILAPLKVRMVVYCGDYLSQSMRHHVARAQAVWLATARLKKLCDKAVNKAWAGSKDAPRKLRRVRAMGQLMCSPAMQLPLLITDLLHLPAGYQRGCLVLQQTCAVFFPLHLCSAQMCWQLVFLGCPQWERQQLIDRIVRAQQASLQPGTLGLTFRCRFCGLLQQCEDNGGPLSKVLP